jgi:5-methylcytosine-specific restriction endonuclease McrA
MVKNAATDGEELCNLIDRRILARAPWVELETALEATGRSDHLTAFFRQLVAVSVTGRIVSGGNALADAMGLDEPVFRSEFGDLLRYYVRIPFQLSDDVYRFAVRAVRAAREPFRNSTGNKIRSWSMQSHPHCYMCGTILDFVGPPSHRSYTCEHIWPRAYGGNSTTENLLPACSSCNSNKKAHFATWVMPSVQSLMLGWSPNDARLQEIDGSLKFALHNRAAQRLASSLGCTLKDAFLRLGPWDSVRVSNDADVVDFFNLENHVSV